MMDAVRCFTALILPSRFKTVLQKENPRKSVGYVTEKGDVLFK